MNTVTKDIEGWVIGKRGVFFVNEVYPDVGAVTRKEKQHVSRVLSRLEAQGFIEKSKKVRGKFKVDDESIIYASMVRRAWDDDEAIAEGRCPRCGWITPTKET